MAAVRLARAEGLKVKARSGGHSWTASSVRDGMLVDLEALDEITVDPASRTATVQPGVKGQNLGAALRAQGLFCPVLDRAVVREVAVATEMDELYAGADALEPEGWRYAPDNMWTNATPDDLIPAVRDLFTTVPNDESHVFWWPWRVRELPDMAFSVQARLYIAAFSAWTDESEREAVQSWGVVDHMRRLEPLSEGIQLADENLLARPHARHLSEDHAARLERLRAEWDPDGLFHSYLTGP